MSFQVSRFSAAVMATLLVVFAAVTSAYDGTHDNNLGKWVPDKGRVSYRHDTEAEHTIYHYFYWPAEADMELLRDDSNETLEMDIVLSNTQQGGPAWSSDHLGDTKGTHWDSNIPTAYRDTLVFDSDYYAFSVGAPFAEQLVKGTWYWWWVKANHNSNSSRAGVEAQHGHRSWNCFMGYAACVFSDDGHGATLIWYQDGKPNEFTMPGECRYVYPRAGAVDPCLAW